MGVAGQPRPWSQQQSQRTEVRGRGGDGQGRRGSGLQEFGLGAGLSAASSSVVLLVFCVSAAWTGLALNLLHCFGRGLG